MKLFKWTAQPFLPSARKVSTHFIAEEWARAGHETHIATVGLSWLSKLKQDAVYRALAERQKNRFLEIEPRLHAGAYIPPLHAFSSRNRVLNLLNRPLFRIYGGYIPGFLRPALTSADAVFFEPGTCLSFFHSARRLNPDAVFVYIKRDWLTTIGAAPYLQELERRILPEFDLVITPSSSIAAMTSQSCRTEILPQAIDKAAFDLSAPSPYEAGTRNAVSVGNMLFDEAAVRALAAADRSVTYHVFGATCAGDLPDNIVVHGEKPFRELVPYIRHADFGIAPYRMRKEDVYLAETSLKFLQYAYCRLPVLTPDLIPDKRGNLVGYSLDGEQDWPGKVAAALAMAKSESFGADILGWDEIAAGILDRAVAVAEKTAA
ncbi:polysaccharide biosynthesis protein GumK [Roseibium sp. AS2]|uniref:GumK N-terminal domain-containing glycosyltransferase n=1 Tax=Roseibium sp. AS2 TaxID=3135781 RepID=UPI003175F3E9